MQATVIAAFLLLLPATYRQAYLVAKLPKTSSEVRPALEKVRSSKKTFLSHLLLCQIEERAGTSRPAPPRCFSKPRQAGSLGLDQDYIVGGTQVSSDTEFPYVALLGASSMLPHYDCLAQNV